MKTLLPVLGRWGLTALLVIAAAAIAFRAWSKHERNPWTRDGHVRADVIRVSTDVGGLVSKVLVRDNEYVKSGQLLLVLDQPRQRAALSQADAAVAGAKAELAQLRKEARRDAALGNLVAEEAREQNLAKITVAEAALTRARADHQVANVNLLRTEIRASVSGTVTNLDIHVGDYLATGAQAMALVDSSSLRVEGYFEETKLRHVAVGDRARIMLMGDDRELLGHVDSIAAGVADDQRVSAENMLPKVATNFAWVRLAQRIPVRIHIDRIPAGMRLIAGSTATVEIQPAQPIASQKG